MTDSAYLEAFGAQLDLLQYYSNVNPLQSIQLLSQENKKIDGTGYVKSMLSRAQPIYVAPGIANALERAVESFPADVTVEQSDFPTPVGFAWLGGAEWDNSIPKFVEYPISAMVRAIAWSATNAHYASIYVFGYNDERLPANSRQHPTQLLDVASWHYGEPAYAEDALLRKLLDADDGGKETMIATIWRDGKPTDVTVNREAYFEGYSRRSQMFRKLTYSLIHFMGQKLVRSTPYGLSRQMRRHLPAVFTHAPVIQVIEYRQREPGEPGSPEAPAPEWSCRWAVRGHWRRIEDKDGRIRAVWVHAYVKGPDGLPLKNPQKLFAVVR